jgi:hypothetical protein
LRSNKSPRKNLIGQSADVPKVLPAHPGSPAVASSSKASRPPRGLNLLLLRQSKFSHQLPRRNLLLRRASR